MNTKEQIENQKSGGYVVPIHEATEDGQSTDDRYESGYLTLDMAMQEENEERKGFRDGDLVIISGKSFHGKTLFAQNLTKNFNDAGIPTIFFSYEVKISNVYKTFMDMGMDKEPNICTPKRNVTGNIGWVKEKIIEADRKYFAKIAVIDHLDFLTADAKNDDFRRNEINNIVRALKDFAIRESKVIVLLAHAVKGREMNLRNDDIADSRQINNLADYIFFVKRQMDEDGVPKGNNGEVKLTKSRHTGNGAKMYFEVNSKVMCECPEPLYTADKKRI